MSWRAVAVGVLAAVAAASLGWGLVRFAAEPDPTVAAPLGGPDAGAACDEDEASRRPLAGFGEVAFRVVAADGTERSGCALLAATPEARAQGLMGQRDLRGYDAMAFRFDGPVTGRFYMYRTPVPLSIAFVDADGEVVSTTDMAPCASDDAGACPTFGADGPYLHALEVLEGDLPALGIGPGATVRFGDEGQA